MTDHSKTLADEPSFTGACPTCGQEFLTQEVERLRAWVNTATGLMQRAEGMRELAGTDVGIRMSRLLCEGPAQESNAAEVERLRGERHELANAIADHWRPTCQSLTEQLAEATGLLERLAVAWTESAPANEAVRDAYAFLSRAPAQAPDVPWDTVNPGRCSECDPSFGCFDGSAPCSKAPAQAAEPETGAVSRTYHDRLQLQLERQRDEHMRRAESAESKLAERNQRVEYWRDLCRSAEAKLREATDLLQTADDPYDMAQWRRERDDLLSRAPEQAAEPDHMCVICGNSPAEPHRLCAMCAVAAEGPDHRCAAEAKLAAVQGVARQLRGLAVEFRLNPQVHSTYSECASRIERALLAPSQGEGGGGT